MPVMATAAPLAASGCSPARSTSIAIAITVPPSETAPFDSANRQKLRMRPA
jgi:hypothetical protein